jgi:hypothetical protein
VFSLFSVLPRLSPLMRNRFPLRRHAHKNTQTSLGQRGMSSDSTTSLRFGLISRRAEIIVRQLNNNSRWTHDSLALRFLPFFFPSRPDRSRKQNENSEERGKRLNRAKEDNFASVTGVARGRSPSPCGGPMPRKLVRKLRKNISNFSNYSTSKCTMSVLAE